MDMYSFVLVVFFSFFQFELMLKGKLHFFRGWIRWLRIFSWSKFTFEGFMPKQIETAKAIANNPQSLPPIWLCTGYFRKDIWQKQIRRVFAIDRRLAIANSPSLCYWQTSVNSHSDFFFLYIKLLIQWREPVNHYKRNHNCSRRHF